MPFEVDPIQRQGDMEFGSVILDVRLTKILYVLHRCCSFGRHNNLEKRLVLNQRCHRWKEIHKEPRAYQYSDDSG